MIDYLMQIFTVPELHSDGTFRLQGWYVSTVGWLMFSELGWTSTAGSNVVQSGRPIFDDFFQHLWPYIGNNTANVVFQMVKRLWLIRIDQ
ncbi:hypothetical protein TNCV_4726481 [Trichonephila clavipes]|nr:hypothetical protein TNCV_4726481 [Trichonephila clavipes]